MPFKLKQLLLWRREGKARLEGGKAEQSNSPEFRSNTSFDHLTDFFPPDVIQSPETLVQSRSLYRPFNIVL